MYLQATSEILEYDACELCQKDISRLKMAIESENWKTPTATRTQQTVTRQRRLLTNTRSVVAGRSVSEPADENDNANASAINVDKDK